MSGILLRLFILFGFLGLLSPSRRSTPRDTLQAQTAPLIVFDDDEDGYRAWIGANPRGYVINTPKAVGSSTPDILHRASCTTISSPRIQSYTTNDFKKIAALNKPELLAWLDENSTDWRPCGRCKP